jgi:hypothetical protein
MIDLMTDVEKYLTKNATSIPHRSNWASDLADPCVRRLVYHRTAWDKQAPPSPYLCGIFETGKRLERVQVQALNEIGSESHPQWELVARGLKLNDSLLSQHQIGGIPDVFLKQCANGNGRDEILGPVEIKGLDPNIFRGINTIDDFQKKPWMRRYPAQLSIYELASNFDHGWFLLFNKSNLFEYRWLELQLDYAYAESLIQKADQVNACVAAGKLPDKINDPAECSRCPYAAHCCPDYTMGKDMTILDTDELDACLLRMAELDAATTEYDALDKQVKALLKPYEGQPCLSHNYVIQWQQVNVKAGTPKAAFSYWKKTITPLKPEGQQEKE